MLPQARIPSSRVAHSPFLHPCNRLQPKKRGTDLPNLGPLDSLEPAGKAN